MIDTAARPVFDEELNLFRDQVRKFYDKALWPNLDRWEKDGIIDRQFWLACGEAGILCPTVAPEYGGLGLDFRYNAVISEELFYAGSSAGITLQSDIVADYIENYGSEEQKLEWLPKMVSGQAITAIAMTEPGTGSDLQAVRTTALRDGNEYVVNGSKTYITNGQNADLIIVVAKTDPAAGGKGISLILVEATRDGFKRGRNLDKIGQHSADTSELFFEDVSLPTENLLGPEEGQGFVQLMKELPQERMLVAVHATAMMERALALTVDYVKQRTAFGKKIIEFQNSQFELAACKTEATIAKAFCDQCLERLIKGELDTVTASMAKYWTTDTLGKVVDRCLQLFGGYGYMDEYPISRLYRDARVMRIYAGTNEIMKLLIARSL